MTLGNKPRNLILTSLADGLMKGIRAPSPSLGRSASIAPPFVSRLSTLLDASPMDLGLVGREIQAQPDLEALAMRLTTSLVLLPEVPRSLEEAVVVLGTDRLRVLAYMWSLLPQISDAADFLQRIPSDPGAPGCNQPVSPYSSAECTPESLYLVSFLRWLGLDLAGHVNATSQPPCFASGSRRGDLAVLTTILMQDFVSLIPLLDPAILMPRIKPLPASEVAAEK